MGIRLYNQVANQLKSPALYTDTLGNRPLAGQYGRLFMSSDSHEIYQDQQSSWVLIADAGVGSGTLQSVTSNGNTTNTSIIIQDNNLSITNTGYITVQNLTNGGILFPINNTGKISQDYNNFLWDATNLRLGIKTNSPVYTLDTTGTGRFTQNLLAQGSIIAGGTSIPTGWTGSIQAYAGLSTPSESHIYNMGVVGTQLASNSNTNIWGIGVYGAGYTNGGTRSAGIMGDGEVNASSDTGSAIGVRGYATATHSGGLNIGILGDAYASSTGNYGIYTNMASGSTMYANYHAGTAQSYFGGTIIANSSITGSSLIKNGGTANQILAADGSVITSGSNITISGGTISSSAGGGMAIGNSITSATSGSVLFAGTSGVLAQDNTNLFWDNTNKNLSIGSNTIATNFKLAIYGSNSLLAFQNSNTGQLNTDGFQIGNLGNVDGYIYNYENANIIFGTNAQLRAIITSGGNVGIGTNSPNVGGYGSITTTIQGASTTYGTLEIGRTTASASNNNGVLSFFNGTNGDLASIISASDGAVNSANLRFLTNNAGGGNTERMRITSGGNVGIGTITPDSTMKLDINSSTTSCRLRLTNTDTGTGLHDGGSLFMESLDMYVTNQEIGNLIFRTSEIERMRITSGGVITISNLAGTGSRAVLADTSGNLSAPVSDISVKQNIKPIGYGLTEILKMNPVWFDFIDEYKNYGEGRQNGNIAQEMQKIIPEAVFITPSTGKMGINYDQLHAIYIKAIQELNEKLVRNNIN